MERQIRYDLKLNKIQHNFDSFSNLVANSVRQSDDITSDSEDIYENVKRSNNINFNRSKSFFDLHHLLSTPHKANQTGDKTSFKNKLTDKNDYSEEFPTKNIATANLKTPLKPHNKVCSTPSTQEQSHKDCVNSSEYGNIDSQSYSINGPTLDFLCKENEEWKENRLLVHTPLDSQNSISDENCFSNETPNQMVTPSQTGNKIRCPVRVTPNKATTPKISTFKQYSLMRAALAAKKDCEDMLRAAKIKKANLINKDNCAGQQSSPILYKNITMRSKSEKKFKLLIGTHFKENQNQCDTISQVPMYKTPLPASDSKINISRTPVNLTSSINKITSTDKCCKSKSLFNASNTITLKNTKGGDNRKSPVVAKDDYDTLVGITQLETSVQEGIQEFNKNDSYSLGNLNKNTENDVDDDLPCTQPISSTILFGVVAYVEIRFDKEDRSEGAKAELESLGAKIEKNFTKKVTHCIFHDGKMSTYRRAVEWKIPIISTLWIEACKAELRIIPTEGHEPYGLDSYKEALLSYVLKPRIRRPMTDSKVRTKSWKLQSEIDKATLVADTNFRPLTRKVCEKDELIDALHTVADKIKKASNQFEEILTSPHLQKRSIQPNTSDQNDSKNKDEEIFRRGKRPNKKLVFVKYNEGECCKGQSKPMNGSRDKSSSINDTNDSINEIRVSYDSDDLLAYAKKQADSVRCSAPARLVTSRKCKKLLSSCHKVPNLPENKNGEPSNQTVLQNLNSENFKQKPRTRQSRIIKGDINKIGELKNNLENKTTSRKRKLLIPSQIIPTFEQDSRESTPDVSPLCPYTEAPNKKQKTTVPLKNSKPFTNAPVLSDGESEDSLTSAARRESSALFVKKQKKVISQRSNPTIVCTSLIRSDVQVVTSIVSNLGKFTVEGTVSERTTHVVTCSPRRTINLLKGIARGCWILNVAWVFASLEANKWLHEEKFELIEFAPSVKQARVERQAFGPEFSLDLFQSVGSIYVCRATVPPASDLTELIRLCGGTVVSSAKSANIIIGRSIPFSPTGKQPLMVKEKWILDSITKLIQLNPYEYIAVNSEP